jgi:hypothetical protein
MMASLMTTYGSTPRTRPSEVTAAIIVRPFVEHDFDEMVARWHETNLESFFYVEEHQKQSHDDARRFFRNRILASCRVWVAGVGNAVGLIASGSPDTSVRRVSGASASWHRDGAPRQGARVLTRGAAPLHVSAQRQGARSTPSTDFPP